MKTTFDLPEPLLREAKSVAAQQGRPLRDLVAEALAEKLTATAASRATPRRRATEWTAFEATLVRLPDGNYFNPQGITDDGFFSDLEATRKQTSVRANRDPFSEVQ